MFTLTVTVVDPSIGPWLGHTLTSIADEIYLNGTALAEKSTPLLLTSSETFDGFRLGALHSIWELEKKAAATMASRPNRQDRAVEDLKFSPVTVTVAVAPEVAEIFDGTISMTAVGMS